MSFDRQEERTVQAIVPFRRGEGGELTRGRDSGLSLGDLLVFVVPVSLFRCDPALFFACTLCQTAPTASKREIAAAMRNRFFPV